MKHKTTLDVRLGAARWTGRGGDHLTAADLLIQAATDCARIFGDAHQLTISGWEGAAKEIGDAGDWDRAIVLMRELENDMETQQQHPNDMFSIRAQLACFILEAKDYLHALPLRKQLAEESLTSNGRFHSHTLSAS